MRFKSVYFIGCIVLFIGLFWLFMPHLSHDSPFFGGHSHSTDESPFDVLTAIFVSNIVFGVALVFLGLFLVSKGNKYETEIVNESQITGLIVMSIIIILIGLILVNYTFFNSSNEVIGNTEAINEINRLLLPVSNGNITEKDFDRLKVLTENDEHASNEVNEMILLAKYNESTHIGHSLGFLYEYIKTGEESICPGHSLSHYYVFLKHGEFEVAKDSLEEAILNFDVWKSREEVKSNESLKEINYTFYLNLINSSMNNIENGNNSISEEDVINLADAPCIK